jgi:hypothetical protein
MQFLLQQLKATHAQQMQHLVCALVVVVVVFAAVYKLNYT